LSEKRFNGDGGLLLAFGLPLAMADAARTTLLRIVLRRH
jgi:hypothetical protein